jgi:hypothetical protein
MVAGSGYGYGDMALSAAMFHKAGRTVDGCIWFKAFEIHDHPNGYPVVLDQDELMGCLAPPVPCMNPPLYGFYKHPISFFWKLLWKYDMSVRGGLENMTNPRFSCLNYHAG